MTHLQNKNITKLQQIELFKHSFRKNVYLPLELGFVVENSVVVSIHSHAVGEHLLLVVEETIGAEIVGKIYTLVDGAVCGGAATAAAHYSDL